MPIEDQAARARPVPDGEGEGGTTPLVAVLLRPGDAAPVIMGAWDAGEAVLPLSPAVPAAELRRVLESVRPTHLVDASGRRGVSGGVPVGDGVAAVVATSGTTGVPKAVELTGAGIEASARAVSAALGTEAGDRWLCCVPLHGVAGLAILARVRYTGTGLVVHDRFDPGRIAGEPGVTLVSLVPTTLARLLGAGAAGLAAARRLRRVLLGGARAPVELLERAAAAGVPVTTTYGMTETFGGVVLDRRPLPGVSLRIAPGGEILVRGPMVMRGYRLDPAGTAAALRDGWLHTGDLGRLDGGGALRVTGRLHDLIITGGTNVAPEEVEAVLAGHPALAEVAVAGLPDPEWGERVVAWAVPAEAGAPPSLGELRDFARASLAAPKLPRQLVLVDRIPRSPAGKVLRRDLPGRPGAGAGRDNGGTGQDGAGSHTGGPRQDEVGTGPDGLGGRQDRGGR